MTWLQWVASLFMSVCPLLDMMDAQNSNEKASAMNLNSEGFIVYYCLCSDFCEIDINSVIVCKICIV